MSNRPAILSKEITLRVNGSPHVFEVGRDIDSTDTLASVLRNKLGLTGLKVACDEGACGACTVIINRRAMLSCMVLAVDADGQDIRTIEGLESGDPIIEAFAEQCEPGYGTALQCGYCTPGFVMTTRALLDENTDPAEQDIKQALSGNLCRCGCYPAITQAVLRAAAKIRGKRS
jgi:carbon-monoxide dehydrogenase small subunit